MGEGKQREKKKKKKKKKKKGNKRARKRYRKGLVVQTRLRTEVLCTPSSTRLCFKLVTSRLWQYIPYVTETPALTTVLSMTSMCQNCPSLWLECIFYDHIRFKHADYTLWVSTQLESHDFEIMIHNISCQMYSRPHSHQRTFCQAMRSGDQLQTIYSKVKVKRNR